MERRRWRATVSQLLVVALLLEILWMLWIDPARERNSAGDTDRPSVSGIPSSCRRGGDAWVAEPMRVDESRRFGIRVPRGWQSEVEDGLVVLREAANRAVLSVGSIPPRDLASAMEGLRLTLYRNYRKVRLTLSEPILLRGCPGREAEGVAVNDQGVRLLLKIILVRAPGDIYTMAGFVKPRADASMHQLVTAMRSIRFL